jgi:hypothetical protein
MTNLEAAEALGRQKQFCDEAFDSMKTEWLCGGVGKICGSGSYALRAGTEWGRSWACRLRVALELQQQSGLTDPDWWNEVLGTIGRRPLTRLSVAQQKRLRIDAWSIPL